MRSNEPIAGLRGGVAIKLRGDGLDRMIAAAPGGIRIGRREAA